MDFGLLDAGIRWRTPASLPWTLEEQPEQDGIVEYRGLEEFGRYLEALVGAVDGMVARAETFLADGDQVVVLGRECGTARTTGRSFAAPFAHVLRVEGAKVAELHGYVDTALLAQAFTEAGDSSRTQD